MTARAFDVSPWHVRPGNPAAYPFGTDDQTLWGSRWWAVRTGWWPDGYARDWPIPVVTVDLTFTRR